MVGYAQLHTGVKGFSATSGFLQPDLRLREAKGTPFSSMGCESPALSLTFYEEVEGHRKSGFG